MCNQLQHLFIYGSLCPGRTNEHILKEIGGTFQPAFVKGYLIHEGWGAEMGFPAITLNPEGKKVPGYVFSSVNLESFWDVLDAFEGKEYKRVAVNAHLGEEKVMEAYIYVLNRD